MAIFELTQTISGLGNETVHIVDVCAVTNSTLERSIVLSITITSLTKDKNGD